MLQCCGCKFFCKPKGVCLGSMPVKVKAVIKSMMCHARYKHSNYLDSEGFHYSYSEVVCFSSAYANSLALMLGFSNGWDIFHDMGFLAWGNFHISSNIWFYGGFRCLGWVGRGCSRTF